MEEIFNLIRDTSKSMRQNIPDVNGKDFWQPIKQILEKYDYRQRY